MKKRLAFFLLILIFCNAYSQVKSNIVLDNVLKLLNLNRKDIYEELYREKVLPYKTSNTLMVIPKYRVNEPDGYGNLYLELDAYIIIADNLTGKILYQYIDENAWTSDAIVLSDITIDTGIYQLNPENRAFGIRVDYAGSSRPNPYNQTDLSLFISQNNTMKRILKNYPISKFRGEWDTNCAGEFEGISGVISIDKNKNNGLSNLIVKNKIEQTRNIPTKDDCVEKKTSKLSMVILKYNGKEYK